MSCPCSSGRPYDACCGPLLDGTAPARPPKPSCARATPPTCAARSKYLLDTHGPATRGSVDRESVARWSREATWLGLAVVETERGGADDQDGRVEFRATYRQGGVNLVHHERSTFHWLDGRWYYRRWRGGTAAACCAWREGGAERSGFDANLWRQSPYLSTDNVENWLAQQQRAERKAGERLALRVVRLLCRPAMPRTHDDRAHLGAEMLAAVLRHRGPSAVECSHSGTRLDAGEASTV